MPNENTSKRAFRKYKIGVTVLVEGEIPSDMSLGEIFREGHTGSYVLDWEVDSNPITGKMMADALCELGSESEFFNLDNEGNDLDD